MHMAYLREQMMLYLKVKATYEPAYKLIIRRKICRVQTWCTAQLFSIFRSSLGLAIIRCFHHMRRLKDDCKRKSSNNVHAQDPHN